MTDMIIFFSLNTIFANLVMAWPDSMVAIMAVRKQKWSNLQQYLGKWLKKYCFVRRKFARVDKFSLVNRNCSFIRVRWKGLSQCSLLFYSLIGSSCWLLTITQRFKEEVENPKVPFPSKASSLYYSKNCTLSYYTLRALFFNWSKT